MGMFDIFSNDDAEQAAAQKKAGLQAGYDQAAAQYAQGTTAATNLTNQGVTGATNAINNGVAGATSASANGVAGATDAINNGMNTAAGYTSAAIAPWQTLFNQDQGGATAYGNASGANGAAGLQTATNDFKNSGQYGAYGFSLDQGLQALDRTHAAAGNLASGNADTDSMKYATGLAGQQYNNYLTGLQPYLGASQAAAGGIAGANTQGGNQAVTAGNALGGIDATAGNTLATGNISAGNAAGAVNGTLYGNLANTVNSNYTRTGDAANANMTGQGNADAAATMNNYNVSANMLGALTGGLNLLGGGFGGGLMSGLTSGGNMGNVGGGVLGNFSAGGGTGVSNGWYPSGASYNN